MTSLARKANLVKRGSGWQVFVILDREFYENEINQVLSDESKFTKIRKDPTEDLKRELNKHISVVNNSSKSIKFCKREGKYQPGYIYGNP